MKCIKISYETLKILCALINTGVYEEKKEAAWSCKFENFQGWILLES